MLHSPDNVVDILSLAIPLLLLLSTKLERAREPNDCKMWRSCSTYPMDISEITAKVFAPFVKQVHLVTHKEAPELAELFVVPN